MVITYQLSSAPLERDERRYDLFDCSIVVGFTRFTIADCIRCDRAIACMLVGVACDRAFITFEPLPP